MIRTLAVIGVLLIPAQLLAADARTMFNNGSKALAAGKAGEAIVDFEAAYTMKPAPSLLYWLGEAHRTAGHKERAASYYKQYLAQLPNGPNAASAKAHLDELGGVAAAEKPKKKSRRRKTVATAELDLAIPPAAPPPPPADDMALPAPSAGSAEEARKIAEARRAAKADAQANAAPPTASMDVLALPDLTPAPTTSLEPTPVAAPPPVIVVPLQPTTPPPPPPPPVTPPPPPRHEPPPMQVAKPVFPQQPPSLIYVTYTARLLAPHGVYMQNYSTFAGGGSDGVLYTHGLGAGVQWDQFKVGGYFGFGTQYGGGDDTLHRFELSGQFQWVPFGPYALISPYAGLRMGVALIKGLVLTTNSIQGGFVLAPQAGVTFQLDRYIAVSLGMGYDANLGASLTNNASISGYSFDLGLTARY